MTTISAREIQDAGGFEAWYRNQCSRPAPAFPRAPQAQPNTSPISEPKRKAPSCPTEHEEQAGLFSWAEEMASALPEIGLLYAIPNGEHRHKAVAGRLKAEGVKAGVPDLFLPVARDGYHGLYVEMKRLRGGRVSPAQREWIAALKEQGYRVEVCKGRAAAAEILLGYLGREAA